MSDFVISETRSNIFLAPKECGMKQKFIDQSYKVVIKSKYKHRNNENNILINYANYWTTLNGNWYLSGSWIHFQLSMIICILNEISA